MKALPDATVERRDVDRTGGAADDYDDRDRVIELYSPERSAEAADERVQGCCARGYKNDVGDEEEEDDEDDDDDDDYEEGDEGNYERRKSKKKHKKHHHRHGVRKKHKKRKNRVDPIFLWAQKRETKIVRVVCEDYDRHNRIRLVRTSSGLWSSNPRSKVLAAAQSRSTSVYEYDEDESHKGCTDDAEASESDTRPAEKPKDGGGNGGGGGEQSGGLVDLNDNSIDFVDTVCSGDDDDEEQRARIDRALEMIERDPALIDGSKIAMPADGAAARIKLPEGTTIHQVEVKAESSSIDIVAAVATPPPSPTLLLPSPPPSIPLSPVETSLRFGELTIIPQQQQQQEEQLQQEPLNLETVGKRCALEIRLQEPPFKKKRSKLPPQPLNNWSAPVTAVNTSRKNVGEPVCVKRESDALAELKEVLSDPGLSVPDPLLVPKARLAALVASPATEIPKLLMQPAPPSLLPPPPATDSDLLAVSLTNLRSMLQQQPSTNIDQMLWLSYDMTSKDMAGAVNDDILSGMLSFLLPPCNSTTPQKSYNFTQQQQQQQQQQQPQQRTLQPHQHQWSDMYYGNSQLPSMAYSPAAVGPGYGKSDDCCAPVSSQQKPLKSRHSSMPTAKQRVCRELCCNGTSPSSCYESCCPKVGACNPFAVSPSSYNPFAASPTGCLPFAVSPTGCNPFAVSPTGCGANLKSVCAAYSATDPVAAAACCYPPEIGYGYNGQMPSPGMVHQKPSISPGKRVQYTANQTGLATQRRQKSPHLQHAECGGGGGVGGRSMGGGGSSGAGCVDTVGGDHRRPADKPQTPPAPAPPGAGTDAVQPVYKPKIKVKKHLIDPNAKPKLLNIEGALHLAGANPQDLLSSPLWHPLFGSQEKRYGCRWQWTTPVTTSESNSPDISGGNVN